MKTLAVNKRAKYDYQILEEFEAGLVLQGQEVKSVKTGHVSLKGAFVTSKGDELYLTNANIPFYEHAGDPGDYSPTRPRKILVKRSEIKRLIGKKQAQGLTLVPLSVYNKKGLIKLKFALAKGKKQRDKRQTIQRREEERRMGRIMKTRR